MNETENLDVEIKLKRGQVLQSDKYGWTRTIVKIKQVDEEIHLKNLDLLDERIYIFSTSNVIKSIKAGVYKILENGTKKD